MTSQIINWQYLAWHFIKLFFEFIDTLPSQIIHNA